jgi:hypothetical protein
LCTESHASGGRYKLERKELGRGKKLGEKRERGNYE